MSDAYLLQFVAGSASYGWTLLGAIAGATVMVLLGRVLWNPGFFGSLIVGALGAIVGSFAVAAIAHAESCQQRDLAGLWDTYTLRVSSSGALSKFPDDMQFCRLRVDALGNVISPSDCNGLPVIGKLSLSTTCRVTGHYRHPLVSLLAVAVKATLSPDRTIMQGAGGQYLTDELLTFAGVRR